MSWWMAIAAGMLFGAGSGALLYFEGRIAGISGVLAQAVEPEATERGWRLRFLLGLLLGGAFVGLVWPDHILHTHFASPGRLVVAGLLVGVGARLANGCTSGHGVCGVGRFSLRSVVAVGTFTLAGALAVRVMGGVS
ncbi:MAG: YeeE/YedE family protein [Sandaracinus sp.]|nr:YeeE/YedE family protein [Myxococcales bacterium]MCB9602608.1 YeeE/YedE family protein [Sandaracinus sp.]MCB9617924.1 YeeE/YedE family protein [Sandaracinus sp.]MCB9635422.1 YeeE/YedE family protein [Sandaracinus sp.]